VALAALKIGGRVAYERLVRPKAWRPEDVPCTPYAITPEWLTGTVCKDVPGAAAVDVEVRQVSAGTHERHRLIVRYNDAGQRAGLPTSIFTKSLPSIVTRMIGGFNGTARVEGNFYTQLRPLLEIEAPLCYHSAHDRETFAAIHLLEDLSATKSATFCDHTTTVSRSMAEGMIDLLAKLHGRFYGDPALGERYRWLAGYSRWFRIGADKMRTEHYTARAFGAAAHVIPVDIQRRRAEVWPATMRGLDLHDSAPVGLIHSDVHIGNWYQTGVGSMGLCDWQCLSRGHWSRDFAYAVTASLTPEDRRAWERDLLRRYIDKMAERSGARLEFEEAFTQYRQQIPHALAMWTITLCHSPLLPAMQPEDASLKMIGRITTAMSDLDSLDHIGK
jgi:hypothetical protein